MPRTQPRYWIPQSHSTLTHVPSHIYCLSSLKCSILTTLKVKHPTRKCFNLLKILKHNSQKFRWGFAPDTFLDIRVLNHTVLWSSVVYCSSISSFKGFILMSIKKSSILQQLWCTPFCIVILSKFIKQIFIMNDCIIEMIVYLF